MVAITRGQAIEVERARLQKGRYHEMVPLSYNKNALKTSTFVCSSTVYNTAVIIY